MSVRLFKLLSHARGLRQLLSGRWGGVQIHISQAWHDKVGEWLVIAVISKGSGTFDSWFHKNGNNYLIDNQ